MEQFSWWGDKKDDKTEEEGVDFTTQKVHSSAQSRMMLFHFSVEDSKIHFQLQLPIKHFK